MHKVSETIKKCRCGLPMQEISAGFWACAHEDTADCPLCSAGASGQCKLSQQYAHNYNNPT